MEGWTLKRVLYVSAMAIVAALGASCVIGILF